MMTREGCEVCQNAQGCSDSWKSNAWRDCRQYAVTTNPQEIRSNEQAIREGKKNRRNPTEPEHVR